MTEECLYTYTINTGSRATIWAYSSILNWIFQFSTPDSYFLKAINSGTEYWIKVNANTGVYFWYVNGCQLFFNYQKMYKYINDTIYLFDYSTGSVISIFEKVAQYYNALSNIINCISADENIIRIKDDDYIINLTIER